MAKQFRVVFVCTGNTCRSPMAEALFRALVRGDPRLRNVDVWAESAGTTAVEGNAAAPEAVRVAAERGLSLSGHRSRRVDGSTAASDLILTMTERHKADFILKFPEAAHKVFTLKEYAGESVDRDLADPFGGDENVYRRTLDEIERVLARAVKRLVEELEDER